MKKVFSKRIASAALALIFVLTLAGCGSGSGTAPEQTTPGATAATESTAPTASTASSGDGEGSATPVTLNLLSHRYAALEYYAQELVNDAPKNVAVETELTTYADWQKKMTVNLSSGSSAYDITYIYPPDLATFASKGWLLPMDDYIAKYKEKYNFDDIPQYLWDAYTYKGHIYGIPSHQWAAVLFARNDLLKEAGLEVPKTLDGLVDAAKTLTAGKRSGLTLTLKASDHLAITFQCLLTACGGSWFDDKMVPAFNNKEAMVAIDYLKKLMKYCPEGSTTYGSDEASLAMTQDLAAMGLLQTTRSSSMDDKEKSKVAGLVGFYPAPSLKEGGPAAALFATAGYSISAFSKNDPDIVFQTIANATDAESMADGAASGMPVRTSVLTDELLKSRPDYAAAMQAIQSGAALRPAIPEFNEIMEISMQALAKVLMNGADAQSTMDEAADQCYKILEKAGYYK
jgi:ABC-type glycerol-3-phosphate transport system substrate-binding protein